MIRLRTSPLFPKQLVRESLYAICTRNTMMGMHRKMLIPGVDHECSKTMLLVSNQRTIMDALARHVERGRYTEIIMDRGVHGETTTLPRSLASLGMLKVEEFMFGELERLCDIHHFDMYIAYSLQEHMNAETLVLDGYEHATPEWPQRSIVEKYMRDMMYK
jgi:hypothetical protein